MACRVTPVPSVWAAMEDLAAHVFPNGSLDVEQLYRWCISKELKARLLRDLSGLGINHRSMFPDLDGIARSLWETEVLWNGNDAASRHA